MSMLKEHTYTLVLILKAFDYCVMIGAGLFLNLLFFNSPITQTAFSLLILVGFLVSSFLFSLFEVYAPKRGLTHFDALRGFVLSLVITFFVLLLFDFVLKINPYPLESLLYFYSLWLIITLIVTISVRFLSRSALNALRKLGYNQHHIVIVGAGPTAGYAAGVIKVTPSLGLKINGYFTDLPDPIENSLSEYKRLGGLSDIATYSEQHDIDEIWIALPLDDSDRIKKITEQLKYLPAQIRFVPDLKGFHLINHSAVNVAGMPVINLTKAHTSGAFGFIKAVEDKVLASLILLAASPFMILIAIAVKLSSLGPVFYRQERASLNGRVFNILKFRSMPVNAESSSGAVWQSKSSQRATRVGKFLRSTSLDELPQFINVLKGEMSIVGPRPERPIFIEKLKKEIPGYMQKHMVKAGITGWAQVNGWRGDTDIHERIKHDLYYIENWSLEFDLQIIFLTIFKGFVHKNAY